MDKIVDLLNQNSLVAIAFIIVVIAVVLMFVIAFFQGRAIEFWPPKIGEKPKSANLPKDAVVSEKHDHHPSKNVDDRNVYSPSSQLLIGEGTKIRTASGEGIVIESDFYGGATATLFRAKKTTGEKVVVKVYWRGLMPNSLAWNIFSREFRASELLSHRNIIKLLDRGLHGGYPFVVMEFFRGGTLRDLLDAHDRIPGRDILSIASQVADAIDFAHSRGVIHRDIKPGNILFESDPHGRIVLSDFGIAKIFGAVEVNITAPSGEFMGSPGYLAPETIDENNITEASDIYSFGVVVYEMICGRIPFDETGSVPSIIYAKLHKDAPSIKNYRNVSEDISNRLAQTLNRLPNQRPKSARAVLSGIESVIEQL
jgi:eukaryotic-like serine/threonine-protein kinase